MQWKSNKYYMFWVCVCSLRYTARNASVPYCYMWPVWLYNIFPHYLVNGTMFGGGGGGKLLKIKFRSSLQLLSGIFLIRRKLQRDMIENTNSSSRKVPVILVRFQWNLEFSRQIFRKMLKYQTSRKSTQWEPRDPCGRTDGQTTMLKPVDASRNVANAPNDADTCYWRIS